MRLGFSQAQDQALTRSASDSMPQSTAAPTTKEIPYDYVARFVLTGVRGNHVQDVINISIEGAFVAVTIGYSFIPALRTSLRPIDFKYSIVDSGSGRELQNRPIHNIAGLGSRTAYARSACSPNPWCSCPAPQSGSKLKKFRMMAPSRIRNCSLSCTATKCSDTEWADHEREPCVRCPSGHRVFQCVPCLRRSLGCRVL